MSELIGKLPGKLPKKVFTPDAYFIQEDAQRIDLEARHLEGSGILPILKLLTETIPGASLRYKDCVGIYNGDVRPGYILQGGEFTDATDGRRSSVSINVSSDGENLEATSSMTSQAGKDISGHPRVRSWSLGRNLHLGREVATREDSDRFIEFVEQVGIVPSEDMPIVMRNLESVRKHR